MKQIIIIISVFLFGGFLHAQDCHSIPLEELPFGLTPEVNGYYELHDAAIPSGDVTEATRSFVDGFEKSIAPHASIPIELVYVRDRDHGIATDVWYHQKVNGDTLQHWYTRIRINAKNEVDYVYVKLALGVDSVQAYSQTINRPPILNPNNSLSFDWKVKLGAPRSDACSDTISGIMTLNSPVFATNDYDILYSEDHKYLRGEFANMLDCQFGDDDDNCIKYDEEFDCRTGAPPPSIDKKKEYIAGNMMFYVNDYVYWLADRLVNEDQSQLENYLERVFSSKIRNNPYTSLSTNTIVSYNNSIGLVTINLGSNPSPNQPHRGHDPDYILSAAFEAYGKLAKFTENEIDDEYLISFSDVLTRLYWEGFEERHTNNYPPAAPKQDRVENITSSNILNNRVKTFGGKNPDNHLVVPDTSNLPEYDTLMVGTEYIEFLNQLWYGIYDNYDDKQGFYDLLELVWIDLSTVPSNDHAAFMELLEKHLSSQFYDRVTEDGKGSAQPYAGLSRSEYEAILEYILRLHGENADEFVSLPLEDYYIKDAGGADCATFTSTVVDSCSDNDRGLEPNEESGGFASQSIWNCPPGQADCESHESPVYRIENENPEENTLRVRVHPIFDVDRPDSIEGRLDLYCVVTTTSISWASWGGEGPFEVVLPDCADGSKELVIGRKVGSVPLSQFSEMDSSGVRIYNVPWIPFNPQDFKGCYSDWNGERVHSCVLAVLHTDQDSFDVGDKSWHLVPNNNNAAARNMSTIWDDTDGLGPGGEKMPARNAQIVHFMSGDPTASSAPNDTVSISLENFQSTTGRSAEEYLEEGELSFWLSEELRSALKRGDMSKSSVSTINKAPGKDGWLRIESPDFRVDNVVLKKGQVYRSLVSYDLDREWQEGEVLGFDIVQRTASGCESGGVRFEAGAAERQISRPTASSDLLLYPNPADHQIRIELPDETEIKEIEIYSLSGQLIRQMALSSQASAHEINIQSFIPGIYFIRVVDKAGQYHYGKFIKS